MYLLIYLVKRSSTGFTNIFETVLVSSDSELKYSEEIQCSILARFS